VVVAELLVVVEDAVQALAVGGIAPQRVLQERERGAVGCGELVP
jgi:hypothetical protein